MLGFRIVKCHIDQLREFKSPPVRIVDLYELSELVNLGGVSADGGGGSVGRPSVGSDCVLPTRPRSSSIPRPIRKTRGKPPDRLNL